MNKPLTITLAVLAMFLVPLAILLLMPLPTLPDPGKPAQVLLRQVSLIDVQDGSVHKDQDVLAQNGRISAIYAAGAGPKPAGVTEIDGQGKFLLPGLWDMHTHSTKLAPQTYHPQLLANGVTGIREMWGCMSEPDSFIACADDIRRWQQQSGFSPRYVQQSSFQINDGLEVPPNYPEFFRARTADDITQLVSFYAKSGVDSLKTYSQLPLITYQLLAEEAQKQGIALAGHQPMAVSLQQLIDAGQRSIEHPRLFLFECYQDAVDFRARSNPLSAFYGDLRLKLLEQQDPDKCGQLMDNMAQSNTWWTPTLQVLKMSAMANDKAFREDANLTYMPYILRQLMWEPDADRSAKGAHHASGRNLHNELYLLALKQVGQAHRAGVKILAGTDAGDTYVLPGFGLHTELAELVKAGLTPAQALKSATLDAARYSGLDSQYGTIEVGKVADLLLLNANPLENIHHTTQIHGLLFNGKYYDRQALDSLLQFAKQQANSLQTNLHLLWRLFASPLIRQQLAD
ncbi:amidohydrolase family protein [Bowmanella dokdonensis]|uniref:Amidohydrolase family protein n=1 Tax=Bowmanella dokdonensis TaxID=751969 RepID=A0A939IMW3_9ALTE|nr:amidohydrolase family protein [Bowmanella dokdonensis]MBN7824220.1 amidohydrolase family protein [Bowmanella dokdonensis]